MSLTRNSLACLDGHRMFYTLASPVCPTVFDLQASVWPSHPVQNCCNITKTDLLITVLPCPCPCAFRGAHIKTSEVIGLAYQWACLFRSVTSFSVVWIPPVQSHLSPSVLRHYNLMPSHSHTHSKVVSTFTRDEYWCANWFKTPPSSWRDGNNADLVLVLWSPLFFWK